MENYPEDWKFILEYQYRLDFDTLMQLRVRAENGDVNAQFSLGVSFLYGNGVPINKMEAVRWLQMAAKESPDAQLQLGCIYMEIRENVGSEYFLTKAALAGGSAAQYQLANLLMRLNRCEEAITWYKSSAVQGHVNSCFELADIYAYGRGVRSDEVQAIYWYREAAYLGNSTAMYRLAAYYKDSRKTQENSDEYFKWLSQAAKAGDGRAKRELAGC